MTSKQRVQATISHKQPDRVPIGLAFSPEALVAVSKRIGLEGQALWDWVGGDFVGAGPWWPNAASNTRYADPTIEVTTDGLYLDIYRVPFKLIKNEYQQYVDIAGQPPLASASTLADLDAFPWPKPTMWDYSGVRPAIEGNPHKAVEGHSRGFFEISHFMRGMDQFLMDMACEPEMACSLMDHIIEHLLGRARLTLEAARTGGFDIFEYNDDVATQRSLIMSPDMWRKHQKPRMARFCQLIHSFGAKVRYHSCGSVRAIIPDLIDIGVDILNPVQALAEGMDPFELKRLFGKHLSFHGGIDIQDFLPHATPQQVREHTKRFVGEVGKDGGLILAASHSLQADTPAENIIAMIETAKSV